MPLDKRNILQFVWWNKWQGIGIHKWEGAMSSIYRYSILLGFLEIRRWV